MRGAISIGLGGSYAIWSGTILDQNKPVVLIADPGREVEGATRLGRIGFDSVAGYLLGGMEQLDTRPQLIEKTRRLTAQALAEQLTHPEPPLVIDVRTEREWTGEGRIEGSRNVPLAQLRERAQSLPPDRELVLYCSSGYRSAIAASLLQREGYRVADLVGGLAAWEAARLPTAATV
jgi:rhodanese-related sulfurtransferase